MLYGTGSYDNERAFTSSPAPRVRPEAVEIAGKHRGMGMQSCLEAPKYSTFGRKNEKVGLSETYGTMKHVGVRSTIPADIIYTRGEYSNRSMKPVPRVKPEAAEIAEKSKGCMDVLFGNYGKPDPYSYQMDSNTIEAHGPLRKAGVRNPILVDPIYQKGDYSGRTPRPVPRVKPEASEFANKSKGAVHNLLKNPDVGSFKYAKPKKTPTDHEKENVRRMRQIQRQSRQREREKEENKATPVKALWKSNRYETVEPKVNTYAQGTPRTPRAPRPSSAPPGQNVGTMTVSGQQYGARPLSSSPNKASPRNFIARNAQVARSYEMGRSRSQMEDEKARNKYNEELTKYYNTVKGKIPVYLQNRQEQWKKAEQERRLNEPDPTVPEGHIVLPESERRETLQILKETTLEEKREVKENYEDLFTTEDGRIFAMPKYTEKLTSTRSKTFDTYPASNRALVQPFTVSDTRTFYKYPRGPSYRKNQHTEFDDQSQYDKRYRNFQKTDYDFQHNIDMDYDSYDAIKNYNAYLKSIKTVPNVDKYGNIEYPEKFPVACRQQSGHVVKPIVFEPLHTYKKATRFSEPRPPQRHKVRFDQDTRPLTPEYDTQYYNENYCDDAQGTQDRTTQVNVVPSKDGRPVSVKVKIPGDTTKYSMGYGDRFGVSDSYHHYGQGSYENAMQHYDHNEAGYEKPMHNYAGNVHYDVEYPQYAVAKVEHKTTYQNDYDGWEKADVKSLEYPTLKQYVENENPAEMKNQHWEDAVRKCSECMNNLVNLTLAWDDDYLHSTPHCDCNSLVEAKQKHV